MKITKRTRRTCSELILVDNWRMLSAGFAGATMEGLIDHRGPLEARRPRVGADRGIAVRVARDWFPQPRRLQSLHPRECVAGGVARWRRHQSRVVSRVIVHSHASLQLPAAAGCGFARAASLFGAVPHTAIQFGRRGPGLGAAGLRRWSASIWRAARSWAALRPFCSAACPSLRKRANARMVG